MAKNTDQRLAELTAKVENGTKVSEADILNVFTDEYILAVGADNLIKRFNASALLSSNEQVLYPNVVSGTLAGVKVDNTPTYAAPTIDGKYYPRLIASGDPDVTYRFTGADDIVLSDSDFAGKRPVIFKVGSVYTLEYDSLVTPEDVLRDADTTNDINTDGVANTKSVRDAFIIETGNQLFDKNNDIYDGIVISSGQTTPNAGYKYMQIDNIDDSQDSIYISGLKTANGESYRRAFHDENGDTISGSVIGVNGKGGEIGFGISMVSGAKTLVLTVLRDSQTQTEDQYDSLMVNYGDTALDYEDYTGENLKFNNKNFIDKKARTQIEKINNDIVVPFESIVETKESKNIFDKDAATSGFYIDGNNGVEYTSANYAYSDFIPITEDQFYYGAGDLAAAGTNSEGMRHIAFYNEAKEYQSGLTTWKKTFTAPFTGYAIISIWNANKDSFQLEEGSEATSYEPFGSVYKIKDSALNDSGDSFLYLDAENANNTYIQSLLGIKNLKQFITPTQDKKISASPLFDFEDVTLNGSTAASWLDEMAPYRFNSTTLGGNHGYVGMQVQQNSHGKTFEDVGSIYEDVNGREYVLIHILTENYMWFSGRSDNDGLGSITELTHVSGGTNTGAVSVSSNSDKNFFNVDKNRKLDVFVDGKKIEYKTQKIFFKDKVTFSETYEIMEKNSMMEWLISNVGMVTEDMNFQGDSLVRVTNNYSINDSGVTTGYMSFLALADVADFENIMFVMSNQIEGEGDDLEYYVPKTLPFTYDSVSYDFAAKVDPSVIPDNSNRINFTDEKTVATGQLADRAIMLRDDYGFALGYLPVQDAAPDVRRANASVKALQIKQDTRKIYMSCIDDNARNSLTEGDFFSSVVYRAWFDRSNIGNRTAQYIVPTNSGDYLYLDWHVTGITETIILDEKYNGKTLTIVEKSADVALLTNEVAGGVVCKITGSTNSNYIILNIG